MQSQINLPVILTLFTSVLFAGFIKLHFWKCTVSDKVLLKKPAEDLVETKQVLRTDAVRCIELQSKNTLSAMLIEKSCGFLTNHTSDMQHMLCHSFTSKGKSKNFQMENCASVLMHSLKNSEPGNMALFPYNKLRGPYYHIKQDSVFSADVQEKHCLNLTKLSHCTMRNKYLENSEIVKEQDLKVHPFEHFPRDTSNMNELTSVSDCVYNQKGQLVLSHCTMRNKYLENSEIVKEQDLKVHPFEHFPRDTSNMNELTSVSDCVYNQKGQLVRMFICFVTEHSDTCSDVSSSDSECSAWDMDCEDFIVFDSSCTDEDECCTRLDFVCKAGNSPKDSCAESLVLTSNLYCEIAMMKSLDTKLDSFVEEIFHPNLHNRCDKFIMNRTSCQDVECKSSEDLPANSTGKTVSKQTSKKKVHFKPDSELAIVYPMIVWNFAYKQARRGTWEADALDRLRFQKRVKELDEILTPILLARKEKVI